MKKFLIGAMLAFAAVALVACGENDTAGGNVVAEDISQENAEGEVADDASAPSVAVPTETPTDAGTEATAEASGMVQAVQAVGISIGDAEEALLAGFGNLHRVDLGHQDGLDVVIWANQPLAQFAIVHLMSYWPDDSQWNARPENISATLDMLQPGNAFVVENYIGIGTFPSMGIRFYDPDLGAARVFFFQENNAYPEHGGRWIIQEIEQDRIVEERIVEERIVAETHGLYATFINGVAFAADGLDRVAFSITGEEATHVTMQVLEALGITAIQGGSQVALQYHGANIGVGLSVLNYLSRGGDRMPVGIYDTFMADNDYFTQHIPLALLRQLGFTVETAGNHVYISGQLDMSQVVPHPLASALGGFVASAPGETRAFVANVDGTPGVLAVQFVDGFAEATLFALVDGAVIDKEIGSVEGFPFSVGFTAGGGNVLLLTGDGGNASYGKLGVVASPTTGQPEIVTLFTIYRERDDDGGLRYYHGVAGTGARAPITEAEFYVIRDTLGERITSWRDLGGEVESILGWVQHLGWDHPAWD